jgi:hypothetical protein
MITELAYTLVLGKPLIMYGGVVTYLLMLLTALVPLMNRRGIHLIPFKYHPWLALFTVLAATGHMILGLSTYFNF